MAATSTVTDAFQGGSLDDPPWTSSYGGADVNAGRGRVPVSQTGGTPDFAGIQTLGIYTLDYVYANVIPAPVNGASDYCITLMTVLSTTGGTNLSVKIDTVANTIRFESNVGFFDGSAVSITYSGADHRWVKIERTGGNIVWSTSPDGLVWTSRRTLAEPAWTSGSSLAILLEAQRGSGSANYAYFASVNILETRHNLCPNPAAGTNDTGWSGTASPVRNAAITGMHVTTGMESTGSGYIRTPTGVVSAGQNVSVSFDVKNNSGGTIAGGKSVFVGFTRSAGGDDFQSFNTAALGVDGNVQRAGASFVAPALATGVYMLLDSIPADIQVSAVLYEIVDTVYSYFDGDSTQASWDGADDNSTSTFNVTTEFTSDLDIRWRVRNVFTSDLDSRWRVRNLFTSDLDTRWRVRNEFASDLDARWRVRNIFTSDLDARWRVRNLYTSDLSIKFRVGEEEAEEGVASYDLNEIMDALAAVFQDVTTGNQYSGLDERITAYADVPGDINTPAIVLELDDLTWDENMGGGADSFTISMTVLVQMSDSKGAQRALRAFLSRKPTSGIARIKTALEANKTLGGLVSYAHLDRVRDLGEITYGDVKYLGADLVIEVMS